MTLNTEADGQRPSPAPQHEDSKLPRTTPPGWAWWVLRAFVTLQALDAFLQPVLEGRFLSGDFAMLALHRTNGTYVGVLSVSQIVVALVAWRVSKLPGRVLAVVIALGAAAGLQIFLGFTRSLGIHVPLGVLIIGCSGGLAFWIWTHRPGDPVRKPPATLREQAIREQAIREQA
jgi:hypothetical protein